MTKIKTVKLKEIVDSIQYGYTTSATDIGTNPYKFLRITDIQENGVNWGEVPYAEGLVDEKEASKFILQSGDIVFARTGATTGKSYLIDEVPSPTIFASYLIRVRAMQSIVIPEYLSLFFQTPFYWAQVEKNKKGAAQAGVNATVLGEIKLPLIPLDEQKKIAQVLEKAQSLIDKRKKTIAKLDELIQAVFLDMFGDPVKNNKGWETCLLGDVALSTRYGTNEKGNELSHENNIPVLRIPNIHPTKVVLKDLKYVGSENVQANKWLLQKGDLLFVRSNGNPDYIGRCATFNLDGEYLYASYLINVRVNLCEFNPYFLQYLFSYPTYRHRIAEESQTTAGNYNINTEALKNLRLIKPKLEEQQNFLDVVENIRGNKSKQVQSLEILENNFNALLQQAFKGELSIKDEINA
ncbi:restriction endonuclease subunit S [Bacillus paramycoides]|uniref:restriction endonuclease subunit S n=1 Tax=Bacillus paramycoides TaxID=2026194 RepID=UPI002E1E5E3A|nr:restriction endonuclease subunit S [Bacillus paramycoides]MED1104988.1 restriction endonuclease subunit S [Bacillus paramycoides]